MKLLTTFFFVFCTTSVFAQTDLDKMMTQKRVPNCADITLNATDLIVKYANRQDYDSVKIILDYWEQKCPKNTLALNTKILLAIKDRTFTELMYDSIIIYHVANYVNHYDPPKVKNSYFSGRYGYYGPYAIFENYPDFNNFTKQLAQELLPLQAEGSVEKLFCLLYADNEFDAIKEIRFNPAYKGTKIKAFYDKEVDKNLNRSSDAHLSLVMGLWSPMGKARVLGNHPTVGFQFGGRYKKTIYSGNVTFKFLATPTRYQTIYRDSLKSTNHFFGGYIGLDVDRELLRWQKSEIDVLAGIAYDGFDAIKADNNNNNNNNNGKTIGSLNLNVGIGYKRYVKRGTNYWGIQGKYNFLNYKNTGGTDLSGNVYTLNLVWGGFSNAPKDSELRRLRYR